MASKKPESLAGDEPGLIVALRNKPRTIRVKFTATMKVAAARGPKGQPAIRLIGLEIDGFGDRDASD